MKLNPTNLINNSEDFSRVNSWKSEIRSPKRGPLKINTKLPRFKNKNENRSAFYPNPAIGIEVKEDSAKSHFNIQDIKQKYRDSKASASTDLNNIDPNAIKFELIPIPNVFVDANQNNLNNEVICSSEIPMCNSSLNHSEIHEEDLNEQNIDKFVFNQNYDLMQNKLSQGYEEIKNEVNSNSKQVEEFKERLVSIEEMITRTYEYYDNIKNLERKMTKTDQDHQLIFQEIEAQSKAQQEKIERVMNEIKLEYIQKSKRHESDINRIALELEKITHSIETNFNSLNDVKSEINIIKDKFNLLIDNILLQLKMDESEEKDK